MTKVSKERAAELREYLTENLMSAGFYRDGEGNDHVRVFVTTTRFTRSGVHYLRVYVAYTKDTDGDTEGLHRDHGASIREITHLVAEAYGQKRGSPDVRVGGGGYNKHAHIVGYIEGFTGVRCKAVTL
jgi:hypothetical protein